MTHTYSYSIISTDFEIEPLLEAYAATYPEGAREYRIVFRGENDGPNTPYSYIIVFTLKRVAQNVGSFTDYLSAWCRVNRKKALASVLDSVFPDLTPNSPGLSTMRNLGINL